MSWRREEVGEIWMCQYLRHTHAHTIRWSSLLLEVKHEKFGRVEVEERGLMNEFLYILSDKAAGCQDNNLFFSVCPPPLFLSFFLLTLTCLCSLYSKKFSISSPLSLSLCTCERVCACLLWCVLQFRTLKQSKIPVGEETQVQSAGGVTTETSWCWQTCLCLCLSLSSPSCPLSLALSIFISFSVWFSLFLLHCQYPYHNISSSATPPPSLPSTTFFHRVSAVPSHCRCGSTSCVGSVATCGRSFRQSWPRRCSARCCQKLYSCWCKDMPGPVLHTRDTCKSGTLSCTMPASYIHLRGHSL